MEKEALLYKRSDNDTVQCFLCSHRCTIKPSAFGICGVRENRQGVLHSLVYGELVAANLDPIEKKPLYHFFPGSRAFSIATRGCNFQCGFCQNWQISQLNKKKSYQTGQTVMPEAIVKQAKTAGALSVSYTYTEPTIFFEYACDVARLAKEEGLYNNFVTNGYMSKEALDIIHPFLDAANVDLKSFREAFYRDHCKAHLQPVLDSIRYMKELGIWVEVTTLVIPGENDSDEELAGIAAFIASIDKSIPWHISQFHPDYRFTAYKPTSLETLQRAQRIAKAAGLHYVYMGNIVQGSDTYCPGCDKLIIKRVYFDVLEQHLKGACCAFCGVNIEGLYLKE